MNNQRTNCSKYEEGPKRKLSLKKRNRKKKVNERNDDCQEQKPLCNKSRKNKKKKTVRPCSHQNEWKCNDLLAKIKPSLSVREKYSNPQHVVCFTEKTQNSQKQNGIIYTIAQDETKNLKSIKVESWCKNFSDEKLLLKPWEIECDSICSFDSVIDLEGLSLTQKELKKIKNNRRVINSTKGNEEEIDKDIEVDKAEE